MSDALDRLVIPVAEATVDALWAQWRVLNPMIAGKGPRARALVDPEALVLGSLTLATHERRLANVAAWWSGTGARLLSVQRMKNLQEAYPPLAKGMLASFARTAYETGDLRWRTLLGDAKGIRPRPKDLATSPIVREPPALMLRLRLGFGVGIKADVVAYLLAVHGTRQTVPAIARATGYHQRAVRRSVEELAAGGFAEAAATAPVSYRAQVKAWRELLELGGDPPVWRSWHSVFSFVATLLSWWEDAGRAEMTPYLLASRTRDFMERYAPRLGDALRLPSDRGHVGGRYLEVFERSLKEIIEWTRGVV